MKKLLFAFLLIASSASYADWHHGKIEIISIGYDGKTISIGQAGSTKTNCTCYPTWPNLYCLNRDRISFNEEYALLLAAKSRGQPVALNIDETTCQVTAMYEN
ncbi:hypothetical protein [Vibrio nigripulchritudo]|uniref:hypothetical protein n=1 Tax=Vibrio nigripulchritudo TaxID=28173 RepID=UPI002492364D|nr:hypothetical protein [Vibrio nigripulchritudo]BDU37579.1 hypothetical protein TUMSATVNIG2_20480 [Vibrio nigripulchritudo]BDU43299.1 hypothetical protein TUMSATVNIG3_20970 [Vibrio nigripulchritudo]